MAKAKKTAKKAATNQKPAEAPAAPAKRPTARLGDVEYRVEMARVADLRKHPENYKEHPADQIEHIAESLRQYGPYKNVVVANDGTLLAGHGVIEAAKVAGIEEFPVRRLDIPSDHPLALKLVALDNELPKFGVSDDRKLADLLKKVREQEDVGLLGTGYDDASLAAFILVTRPASEVKTINEANEWVGMPDYYEGDPQIRLVITFKTDAARKKFVKDKGLTIVKVAGLTWSSRWPTVKNEDVHALKFAAGEEKPTPKKRAAKK